MSITNLTSKELITELLDFDLEARILVRDKTGTVFVLHCEVDENSGEPVLNIQEELPGQGDDD